MNRVKDQSAQGSSGKGTEGEQAGSSKRSGARSKEKLDSERQLSHQQAFRRIFSLSLKQWKPLLVATLCLFLGTGFEMLYPFLAGDVLDSALGEKFLQLEAAPEPPPETVEVPGDTGDLTDTVESQVVVKRFLSYLGIETSSSIGALALALMFVFFFRSIFGGLRQYLFSVTGLRIVTDLRRKTYQHIVHLETGFFDERKTGELMSRLSSDTVVLQGAVTTNVSSAFQNIAIALGGIILLLLSSPKLTLLMLVLVPPVSLGAVFFGRLIRKLSKKMQDALARAGEVAQESISGIRTVRAFTKEDYETERYGESVEKSFGSGRSLIIGIAFYQHTVSFAAYSAVGVVLWYGSEMVANGTMTPGDLVSFIMYTLLVAGAVGGLGGLWGEFMRATGAAERIFEILDRKSEIPLGNGKKLPSVKGALAFENVSFSYPSRPDVTALSNINLDIKAGEIVALVGPSGSGKSTMANLITRFYNPSHGRILLDGEPIDEMEAGWLRDQIGTVPQEPILFSISIEENIGYGKHSYTQEEIYEAARIANAHDFITRFPEGYGTEVGERGIQLSGGQKQRVAIARAVLKDPKILILDEATSALDAESEHLVKEALDRLMKGRTTLIIAHRLSTVKDADRVVVLDRGEIQESGTHEFLLNSSDSLYRRLVEHQYLQAEN